MTELVSLSQHVVNAVVAHVLRFQRSPRVLLAESDAELRATLSLELRIRGFDVEELSTAKELHQELHRCLEDPEENPVELIVASSILIGCSPLHAISYARHRGLRVPVVVLADAYERIIRGEADSLAIDVAYEETALEVIDRSIFRSMQRRWSERPARAA